MSISAQQRNTNEIALPTPSLTITTTGAVKFALIEDELSKFDRVDMVFDRYFEFSTKAVTRTKRSEEDRSKGLLMFHSLTGCNTTDKTGMLGITKHTAFQKIAWHFCKGKFYLGSYE